MQFDTSADRRTVLKGAGAVGAAMTTGLAGCLGDDSGDTITVGMWAGDWENVMEETVINQFEDDTGTGVERLLGGPSERMNRLLVQADDPEVDAVQQDGAGLVTGANEDIWTELDSDLLPSYDRIPDSLKSDTWVAQVFASGSLIYNTETFSSPPDSWGVYLDEAYEGRVGLYPEFPGYDLFGFSLHQTDGETHEEIDLAFEMFKEVVDTMDPRYVSSAEEYGQLFTQGDLDIGRFWNARANQWGAEGPVDSVIPQEGALTTIFGNAIPANIPDERQELAGQFIDFTFQEEAAVAFAEMLGYTNSNPDIEYPDEIADDMITGDTFDDLISPDYAWMSENESDWRQRANEIIDDAS